MKMEKFDQNSGVTAIEPAAPVAFNPTFNQENSTERLGKYKCLAEQHKQRKKLEAAQRCLEKAVYIAVSTYGPTHLEVGSNLQELGTVLYERGMREAAAPLMARAKRILQTFE